MKRVAITALILLLCLLCACKDFSPFSATPTPEPKIESFYFSIGGFGAYNEYAIDGANLTFEYTLTELYYGDQAGTFKQQWDEQQWEAFTSDVLSCGVLDWDSSYDSDRLDGTQWSLELQGNFGSVSITGSNTYPKEWAKFLKALNQHFGLDIW